mgnify:CR=1 FL=1|tara:strand:- start:1801 stop:2214 length:414 start_codon:yes stop_codon:yes gene_type:complete
MGKKFLKKIIAQNSKDLQFISACCSEGRVNLNEIKYLPKNKIFLFSIERLMKEEENTKDRINSIIRFDYIESSKSKNINQKRLDLIVKLMAIDIFKKNNNYEISLLFSNNGLITLSAEIIEVTLEDQKILDDKNYKL